MRTLALSLAIAVLAACSLLRPPPPPGSQTDRLAGLPRSGLPLEKPVQIYWNDTLVPIIEAQTDSDAAFALGLVHAHLRLGQMELLRRVSAGRISESAGPFSRDIDQALRTLDLGRAVPAMEKALPPETRAWLTRFVEGINFHLTHVKEKPYEFHALAWTPEPWAISDVLRLSRLAGADVSWFRLLGALVLQKEKGYADFEKRYRAAAASNVALLGPAGDPLSPFALFSRTGSNSFVVGRERSASRAPLIANDPHLGISIPNVWMILGLHSPSYNAVGMTIPGIPFIALGRNESLAWGGTNMHALSSDLYDVSHLADDSADITSTEVEVGVRSWFNRHFTARNTAWGPLVSDIPLLKKAVGDRKIALKWMGHSPSDEISAFLRANRARTVDEFSKAFSTYAVSGQNLLFASKGGEIGQIFAVAMPDRPRLPASGVRVASDPAAQWKSIRKSTQFPVLRNPKAGFLASANQEPPAGVPYVGEFFAPRQRVDRLNERLAARRDWNLEGLSQLQRDAFSQSSYRLKQKLVAELRAVSEVAGLPWLKELENWDGHYTAISQGAVIHQQLTYAILQKAYAPLYSERLMEYLLSADGTQDLLAYDLKRGEPEVTAAVRAAALEMKDRPPFKNWGEMHRLRLAHPLSYVPLIGSRFQFADLPGAGSIETVQKTAHGITADLHAARYGSQARHVSDLSDVDANFFVVLGGQDGWFGSKHLTDQVALWQKGTSIQVPMTIARTRALFTRTTPLSR